MTKSINGRWLRALATAIGLALTTTGGISCFIVAPPKPCTCDCICNTGHSYCKSHDAVNAAGSTNCHNICFGIGVPADGVICKDKTQDIPLPPPPDPRPTAECTDQTPDVQKPAFVYCETCPPPTLERDFPLRACTQDEADDLADAKATADGGEVNDCSVERGFCLSPQ